MTSEYLEGFSHLNSARDALRKKQQAFGGIDGSAVTFEDIIDLVLAHLKVTLLEKAAPEGHRRSIDFMRTIHF